MEEKIDKRSGGQLLMIVTEVAHFTELDKAAKALRSANYVSSFLFYRRGADLGLMFNGPIKGCEKSQLPFFLERPASSGRDSAPPRTFTLALVRIVRKLLALASVLPGVIGRYSARGAAFLGLAINEILFLQEEVAENINFIKTHRFKALILAEDNPVLNTFLFTHAGKAAGIPVIIVPYTIANPLELAEGFSESPERLVRGLKRAIMRLFFPEWLRDHKGLTISLEAPSRVLAIKGAGYAPRRPWHLNDGVADYIAVESDAMHRVYASLEIDREKLVITGSANDEILQLGMFNAAANRKLLLQELQAPDRPVAVFAVPPNQFPRTACEFRTYSEMLGFFSETFREIQGFIFLWVQHPKSTEPLEQFLQGGNSYLVKRPTVELVPLCDLYLAQASATIRWAIGCGKPAINYDVYQYGYGDYSRVAGVLEASSRNQFIEMLHKAAEDPSFYSMLAEGQKSAASEWAKNSVSFAAAMSNLISSHHALEN